MKYFNYNGFWTRKHVRSLVNAVILLILAVVFQYYASAYVNRVPSNSVADLFLSILPVVNLNFLIIEGALCAIGISIILILAKPQYLLFTLKAAAIFIATRAVFIAVTHIGIYPGGVNPDPTGIFDRTYTGLGLEAGFFFSGHTGLPFLVALIMWKEKFWRYAYLVLSVVFGIAVLFAHVHYTIDVLAAPYMAYGIFKMSQYFFADDWKMTES
ncbi:MAG TPA: phosphatase PAP2-related protein [Candidatus Paceibacterota bacterium]